MAVKRGTNVEFVGSALYNSEASARFPAPLLDRWFQQQVKYYGDKYGIQLGDKGNVVRAKNGWIRVSWTLQDGSKATSVPMRQEHFTVKPNVPQEEYPGIGFDQEKCKLVGTEPTMEHIACARLLKSSREVCSGLEEEVCVARRMVHAIKAELYTVNMRLISSRTLMQLKDKTIAELRGAHSFERWGDWVVPEVGSG
jgi:hypothetical protein